MKKIQSKMMALECLQDFSHYKSMGIFFRCSRAAKSAFPGLIGVNFELMRNIMVVLLICKNEEEPIKNECVRVLTKLYINFSDTQGQLTPQSVVESSRNSNSSKLLWLSFLSAKKKKIQ